MDLIDRWNANLRQDSPCGDDVSFEPEFETVKGEVAKENSMYAEGPPDWPKVLELSTAILSEQSKDIWVFCYGCRAAYAVGGLASCAQAVAATHAAVSSLWDCIHPRSKRLARRTAPFAWLSGKFESLFAQGSFPQASAEDCAAFRTALEALQSTLQERFGDDAPSFSATIRAIPDAEREKARAAAQEAAPAQLQDTPADGPLPADYLPKLFRSIQDGAQQLASHYLNADFTDWRAYLLHRTALWSLIGQLPPHDENLVTQLRPLPNDKMLSYSASVESGQYQAVLPQLERSMGKQAFWFDGHHLVARCLEALGATSALEIVHSTLRQFLARYPELPDFKFHDGTPFASFATQRWIAGLRAEEATPIEERGTAPGGENVEEQLSALEQALRLSAKKGFKAGLAVLDNMPLGRNRTSIQQAIVRAEYCMASGKDKSAAYILHGIYSRLRSWDMLDWEPELSAKVLSLLFSAKRGKAMENREEALEDLCGLHFESAIDIVRE